MEKETLLKATIFLAIGVLVGILFCQTLFWKASFEKELSCKESLGDVIEFGNIKTFVPDNGIAGMFDGNRQMLYVKTNEGLKQICLYFFHELGHAKEWKDRDQCFYDANLTTCEEGAIEYASKNAYRCEDLN